MNRIRLLVALLLAVVLAVLWYADAARFLSLDALRAGFDGLRAFVDARPVAAGAAFVAAYTVLAGINFPGAALTFTLAAGAFFGVAWGSALASVASTAGATLGCALARFLLQDVVERNFPLAVARVNDGLAADGPFYLFGLRLVPIFPFFVINLVMGLTRLPLRTFAWVSQVGMLPGTVVFVNAGTQLAEIRSTSDILTPGVAGSLTLLGIFPLVAKKALAAVNRRRHPDA